MQIGITKTPAEKLKCNSKKNKTENKTNPPPLTTTTSKESRKEKQE